MSETPSWMTAENATTVAENPIAQEAAKNAASNPNVQKAVVGAAVNHVTGGQDVESQRPSAAGNGGDDDRLGVSEETLAAMKKWHLGMRLAMVGTAILMALASVLTLQGSPSVSTAFICFYVLFFAVLLFCFEFGLMMVAKLIASNFGFMYSASGRLVFMCIVAGMCFRLDILGKLCIGLIALLQCVYLYVLYRFPKYEEYLRKKHYYAEKNFA